MRKKHRPIAPARARPPVIYERRPLEIPDYGGLPEALRSEIEASERSLGTLCPLPPATVRRAPAEDFAELWHPLSEAAEERRVVVGAETCSDGERDALALFEQRGGGSVGDFRAELAGLNARLTSGRSRWRTGPICLHADAQGAVITFPHPRFIGQQVARLYSVMNESKGPTIFRAASALALVVNAHAFTDGNGRTARTMFNHVLRQGGLRPDVYVPVFEFASKSRGGFEISLRSAEIFGKWEPLLQYFVTLLKLQARMAEAAQPDRDASALCAEMTV